MRFNPGEAPTERLCPKVISLVTESLKVCNVSIGEKRLRDPRVPRWSDPPTPCRHVCVVVADDEMDDLSCVFSNFAIYFGNRIPELKVCL